MRIWELIFSLQCMAGRGGNMLFHAQRNIYDVIYIMNVQLWNPWLRDLSWCNHCVLVGVCGICVVYTDIKLILKRHLNLMCVCCILLVLFIIWDYLWLDCVVRSSFSVYLSCFIVKFLFNYTCMGYKVHFCAILCHCHSVPIFHCDWSF